MGCCPWVFTSYLGTELEPLREQLDLVSGLGEIQARWAEVGERFLHQEHFPAQMQNNLVNSKNSLNRVNV